MNDCIFDSQITYAHFSFKIPIIRAIKNNHSYETIFIFPFSTQIQLVKKYISLHGLNIFTIHRVIPYLLENIDYISIIVIFDAHLNTTKYEFLVRLCTLLNNKRIIFVGPVDNFSLLFPDIKIIHSFGIIKLPDLVNIEVDNIFNSSLFLKIDEIFNENNKILVFLPNLFYCHKYFNYFHSKYNCYIMKYVRSNIFLNDDYILFLIDYCEIGLPIHDIDVIIDFGLFYDGSNNRIMSYNQSYFIPCSKKINIQIKKECFQNDRFMHYWNTEYLLSIKFKINPLLIIPKNNNYIFYENNDIFQDTKLLDIIIEHDIKIDVCKMIKKVRYLKQDINFCLLILSFAVINFRDLKLFNNDKHLFYYYRIINLYFKEKDELLIIISLFLTLYFNKTRSTFQKEFNINLTTFRKIMMLYQDLIKYFDPAINWRNFLYSLPRRFFYRKNIKYCIFDMRYHKTALSYFLFVKTDYDIKTVFQNLSIKTIINHFKHYFPYMLSIHSDPVLKKTCLFLYPHHHIFYLQSDIKNAQYKFYQNATEKMKNKKKFNLVLDCILNDVPYMPYNWGMEDTINKWQECLFLWNGSLTNF